MASCIWAFSFGLLGRTLDGVSGSFVACARLALAACVFLPFLRRAGGTRGAAALLAIGGVQFGLMYLCYNESFVYLQAHEVALLTVFTPLYVTLLHDAWRGRVSGSALLAACLATLGAGVVLWQRGGCAAERRGFLLIQAANLCFAVGQLAYRGWARRRVRVDDAGAMGWLYLGGMLAVLPWALLATPRASVSLSWKQAAAVVYLGVVASGLGFFLWNAGARRVTAGMLAVCNNLKIPLTVAVSLLLFGGRADPARLAAGSVLFAAAVWFGQRARPGDTKEAKERDDREGF